MRFSEHVAVSDDDSIVVSTLKKKISDHGGTSYVKMLRGEDMEIFLSFDGRGIIAERFPALVMEWEVFDAIIAKANELGGVMLRGDGLAQKGLKVGSEDFPLSTMDAFLSIEFFNGSIGKSTTRRSTYFAAVLAWAGIVENDRATGHGGFIKVLPPYNK